MPRTGEEVSLSVQVIAGIGGILLVVGMALSGLAFLEHGDWGALLGTPGRIAGSGLLILMGSAIWNAIGSGEGDRT